MPINFTKSFNSFIRQKQERKLKQSIELQAAISIKVQQFVIDICVLITSVAKTLNPSQQPLTITSDKTQFAATSLIARQWQREQSTCFYLF